MKNANMKSIELSPVPIVMTEFNEDNPLGEWLYEEALKNNIVHKKYLDQWMRELKQKSDRGDFYGVVNMNIVTSIK
jgi:hypothetical protein